MTPAAMCAVNSITVSCVVWGTAVAATTSTIVSASAAVLTHAASPVIFIAMADASGFVFKPRQCCIGLFHATVLFATAVNNVYSKPSQLRDHINATAPIDSASLHFPPLQRRFPVVSVSKPHQGSLPLRLLRRQARQHFKDESGWCAL